MNKRHVVILLIIIMMLIGLIVVYVRQIPSVLENLLEQGLNKEVRLEGARHHFPLDFEIQKLTIFEKGIFEGEISFYVENIYLKLNPYYLVMGKFVISELNIQSPQITIRKMNNKIVHALSRSEDSTVSREVEIDSQSGQSQKPQGSAERNIFPLTISKIHIRNGFLKWIDFDIAEKGFVIQFKQIEATLQNLSLKKNAGRIKYDVRAMIAQGRNHRSANLEGNGWTHVTTWDTDANFKVNGIWIPYFVPYYKNVTYSQIDRGLMNIQSTTIVKNKNWTTNARASIQDLVFGSYEPGSQLFGFDATTLINILRDQSGRVTLDIIVRWNMRDPNVTFHDVLRKSIRRSLKSTFLSNIQNVVENTIDRVSKDGGALIKRDLRGIFDTILDAVGPAE